MNDPVQHAFESEAFEMERAVVPVALGQVRAAGKKPMPAADWARGVRVDAGERLA